MCAIVKNGEQLWSVLEIVELQLLQRLSTVFPTYKYIEYLIFPIKIVLLFNIISLLLDSIEEKSLFNDGIHKEAAKHVIHYFKMKHFSEGYQTNYTQYSNKLQC